MVQAQAGLAHATDTPKDFGSWGGGRSVLQGGQKELLQIQLKKKTNLGKNLEKRRFPEAVILALEQLD